MSFNHLTIGSTTGFNRGGNPVAERAAVQRQSNPSADAPGQSAKADAPVRRNTLVAAMMQAMQSLVGASPPAASPPAANPAACQASACSGDDIKNPIVPPLAPQAGAPSIGGVTMNSPPSFI